MHLCFGSIWVIHALIMSTFLLRTIVWQQCRTMCVWQQCQTLWGCGCSRQSAAIDVGKNNTVKNLINLKLFKKKKIKSNALTRLHCKTFIRQFAKTIHRRVAKLHYCTNWGIAKQRLPQATKTDKNLLCTICFRHSFFYPDRFNVQKLYRPCDKIIEGHLISKSANPSSSLISWPQATHLKL
jgi:hypothetical protein